MNRDDETKKRQGQGQGQGEEHKQGGRPATKFIEREKTHPENRAEGDDASGGETAGEIPGGETSYEDPSKQKKMPDPNWKEGPYTQRDKDKEEGSGE